MSGADVVRWDVAAVESKGPFKLTILHPAGTIVEYFDTAAAALARERAIENALTETPSTDDDSFELTA